MLEEKKPKPVESELLGGGKNQPLVTIEQEILDRRDVKTRHI